MIDLHCHILAGLDDGPSRLDISAAMAAIAVKDGIHTIIATPHADGIIVNRQSVEAAVLELQSELLRLAIPVHIAAGFEIPYDLIMELAPDHTLAGGGYVLLELPHTYVPADAPLIISQLLDRGLKPIIAHPERNSRIIVHPERLGGLVAAGALAQLTAASITGELGPDVQRCAHFLLSSGVVHFIATDSHSPTFRTPELSRARTIAARLLGRERADDLVTTNPARILHNSPWQT